MSRESNVYRGAFAVHVNLKHVKILSLCYTLVYSYIFISETDQNRFRVSSEIMPVQVLVNKTLQTLHKISSH